MNVFFNDWIAQSGCSATSQDLYSAYQHWVKSLGEGSQVPAGGSQCDA